MRPVLIFLLVFVFALLAGALLAYPLYLFTSLFTDAKFSAVIMKSTQLCGLIFSLFYLKYADHLTLETIGLQRGTNPVASPFWSGFLGGLLLFGGLALGLFAFGIYDVNDTRETSAFILVKLLIGALLTGVAVALFEETVFRGALLQGLRKQAGMNQAVLTISLLYAATHFISYAEPADHTAINWLTAAQLFIAAYTSVFSLQTIDALLSLFVLGLLFALIRIRTKNLFQCIGLHAGVVAGVKLFRFFAEYKLDNPFNYLVSTYDNRLGWLAFIWLLVVTVGYFIYLHRKPKESTR